METRKLYYEDCHLTRFTATVTGCEKTEKGYWITLDATAFYPEGGGQACDLGTLGGEKVLHVREEGESVLHLCEKPLEPGTFVEGEIDYSRRFDLMQQHTGEHIVSGLIHAKFGYHNVGFHIGQDVMEVDFDGPIDWETLMEIEAKANRAVWQNLPIRCRYPSAEELPRIPYRTKKALPWPVRIVQVPGYDSCACCGVHTAFTGEVGLIKILSCVKFHQGVRMEMVCGNRAYSYLSRVLEQNRQVSQLFSAKPLETGTAAQKINDALAAEKFRAAALEKRIFATVAEAYRGSEKVLHFEENLTPGAVRELTERIAANCVGFAAVFSGNDNLGYSYCLGCREGDLRQLCRELNQALNGRGGGKPAFQQGSVRATRAQIEGFFAEPPLL